MGKNFENRRAIHCLNILMGDADIMSTIKTIRVPNINFKQLRQIVMYPESVDELTLAKKIVQLAHTISENIEGCTYCTEFKPLESEGYLYFDYATSLFFEELYDSLLTDSGDVTLSKISDAFSILRNLVFGVANDARNTSLKKYHKLCCEVNILNNSNFYNDMLTSLCEKDDSIYFRMKTNFPNDNGEFRQYIETHVKGLGQILFLGENNNEYAGKEDLSASDIQQAIQFVQTFDEYIKSLSKSTSRN